jgi:hypothetical protein
MKKSETIDNAAEAARAEPPVKWCVRCGRKIEWRRKWRRNWDQVRYCSLKCRREKLTAMDRKLEKAILQLLRTRRRGASICPSEVARFVRPPDEEASWRELMEPARNAARRLAARGQIAFQQEGRSVDPSTAKGPVRLKLN